MRWNGQELGVEQQGTLPGLARLNNLVRSVQTPEFAGVTFHEVLAKSALNKVPGQSYVPFGWTINPYRGCSHACVYCLDPSTSITLADGSVRSLRELRVGDVVVGTTRAGPSRTYTASMVLAKWSTRKRGLRITLADGTSIIASGDHRFLTEGGWKHVTGAMDGSGRPYLTTADSLIGLGPDAGRTRLRGGSAPREPFAGIGNPAIVRRPEIIGSTATTHADLRVVSIEPLGAELDLLDITTSTGDFIANGVVSHNCFARPTHEYLDLDAGDDFDREIVVKINVAEVLQRELARPSWRHEPVALGTNTDPYQRAEGRYALMPGIIDALASSGTPFSILTKGTLLRRDLPLLQAAREHVPVDLAMSIAVYDDEVQRSIEPGTPTTAARLATVTAAREAGFDCSVFLMPILPYLTDTKAHLDEAVRRAEAAGATSLVYSALHLRGSVKPWFFDWLGREHPELVDRYRAMYPGSSAYAPKEYRAWLAERMRPLLRAHRMQRGREDVVTGGVASSAPSRWAAPRRPAPLRSEAPGLTAASPTMLF
ncbi:Rv2578c family radical SAM protein [Agromyces sp. CCNWLW213]|uniref:Rv2578c family radical SAM protein n=1 Tax=Agromyces sp. CCNWLW213 TaxID=3128541 RepID=UPI003014CC64